MEANIAALSLSQSTIGQILHKPLKIHPSTPTHDGPSSLNQNSASQGSNQVSPYVSCLLKGSLKPVWHTKSTCRSMQGRIVDEQTRTATGSVSFPDDPYVQCVLGGRNKPVWHIKSTCIQLRGRVVTAQESTNSYVKCLLSGARKPVWHQSNTCLSLGGRILD